MWLSIRCSVIMLLHWRTVSRVVLSQSRHRSQVCGGRWTWHIWYIAIWQDEWSSAEIRWGEQWPDAASDRLLISPIILPSCLCTRYQLLLSLMSYLSCQRFSSTGLLFVCVCLCALLSAACSVGSLFRTFKPWNNNSESWILTQLPYTALSTILMTFMNDDGEHVLMLPASLHNLLPLWNYYLH